jgi:hypothetical protein
VLCISFKHDNFNDAIGSLLSRVVGLQGKSGLEWMWKEAALFWNVPSQLVSCVEGNDSRVEICV